MSDVTVETLRKVIEDAIMCDRVWLMNELAATQELAHTGADNGQLIYAMKRVTIAAQALEYKEMLSTTLRLLEQTTQAATSPPSVGETKPPKQKPKRTA